MHRSIKFYQGLNINNIEDLARKSGKEKSKENS